MLAVWCFTVFAAVGERLAVSGKSEEVEVVEDEEEGGWMESGRTPRTPRPSPLFFERFSPADIFYQD